MLQANFDQLEKSLVVLLELMKKRDLLVEASHVHDASNKELPLKKQQQQQALVKAEFGKYEPLIHERCAVWNCSFEEIKQLVNSPNLFDENGKTLFTKLFDLLHQLEVAQKAQLEKEVNEEIIRNQQEQTRRKPQIKQRKNWNPL